MVLYNGRERFAHTTMHHERPDATSGILPQEGGASDQDPHHSYWRHWVLRINPLLVGGGPRVAVAQDTRGELPIMHSTHKGIEARRRTVDQISFFTYEQVEPYHLSDGDRIRVQTSISGGTTVYHHRDIEEASIQPPLVSKVAEGEI